MRSLKTGLHPFTLVAALFTIAKAQRASKCPTADEWINKMWCVYIFLKQIYTYIYIHNGILFYHKTEGNPTICNNINEPGEY